MSNLTRKRVDELATIVIEGKIDKLSCEQITKEIQSLEYKDHVEFERRIEENSSMIMERLENDRLKMAKKYVGIYQDIAQKIFKKIGPYAISEIYETAKCINLELTSGIYFLRNTSNGLLKIGYGKDLFKRIRQIKGAFKHIGYGDNLELEAIHLCFEPHLSLTETYFHSEFKDKRVKGEWFKVSPDELVDYFLFGDFEGDFVDNVLVSWADYESLQFKPLAKDFNINIREMEFELYEEILPQIDNNYLFRCGVRNKFYQIIKVVEENKIGITGLDLQMSTGIAKKVGITVKDATNNFDFLKLKCHKYNPKEIRKAISKINKLLVD